MPSNQALLVQIVQENRIHPKAEEILTIARKFAPKISLGTVYRNLNQLVDSGKLRRISIPGEPDSFDVMCAHDHMVCTQCKKIIDLERIDSSIPQIPEGVEIHRIEATAYGLCPACGASRKKD